MGKVRHKDFDFSRRSDEVIAQGCLTNSKSPKCLINGVYPTHVSHAKDSFLYCKNNDRFIDFIGGLGTNLLGYANKELLIVAQNEMLKGQCYSLASKTEVIAAERFRDAFRMEKWKFMKSGTEACMAAVKMARAYTNRNFVLSDGYHGWSNEFINAKMAPPGHGVPDQVYIDKLEDIQQINKNIAAVIIEPVVLDHSVNRIKYLHQLRDRCTQTGTVLIYDEVITGGRYQKLSVSNFTDIRPDLIVLGKAVANGFPLAAVGGLKDILDGDYFVSGTYAGENVSLAVATKVLKLLMDKQDYDLELLWGHGQTFLDEFNTIWPEKIYLAGYPTRARFQGFDEYIHVFWQQACKSKILFGPSWFFNFPHIELDKFVIEHCKDILSLMKIELPALEGETPCKPISNKLR